MDALCIAIPAIIAILGLMLAYSGITLLLRHRRTKKIYASVVGGFATALLMIAIAPLPSPLDMTAVVPLHSMAGDPFYTAAFTLLAIIAFGFLGFIAASFIYEAMPKRTDSSYIIVLGAGLVGTRVSRLLAMRLEKAIELWNQGGRAAHIIVTGAQGADESIPEAYAMHAYLLSRGIPEDAIIDEPYASSTEQNMQKCKELIDSLGSDSARSPAAAAIASLSTAADANDATCTPPTQQPAKCTFVTNGFHLLRTKDFARRCGLAAQGVASHTVAWYWPGAIAREYVAMLWTYGWLIVAISAVVGIATSIA